jgi:NitT/TauT family transport system ATP-binding protein
MSDQAPLVEAKEIGKDFPSPQGGILHVLKKVNVALYSNEIVAIIGPSGCGKSTLLRILAGLIPQTTGEVLYQGQEIHGLLPDMCMVFQSFALYPWMTVKQNIEIVLKAARVSVEEMEKKVTEAIALIGLVGFEEAYPREISGGMKQRVGIARALVRNPKMLFMDEPFSELDAFTAETLRSEVIKIWANKDVALNAILLVSHDIHEVVFMADRIIVLGMNSTSVRGIIENKIPRPRDYRSADFLKLVEQVHDTYGHIEPPTVETKPAREKAGRPLLSVTPDEILGLLEYLNRHEGSQDIFKIGPEIHQHFDKISSVLQAAQLLDFIDIVHRSVNTTEKGKVYLTANREERHQYWKDQLLILPIFTKICDALKNAPEHSLKRSDLIGILKEEFPHQDPALQWTILIHWGHYGHIFTYHRVGKYVTLNDHSNNK